MTKDVYSAPDAELIDPDNDGLELATRMKRLVASMLDGFVMMLFIVPLMYFTGGYEGIAEGVQPSITYSLMMGLFGIAVFAVINGKFLLQNGQTIGKKALDIKIVSVNGDLPSFKNQLLPRYGIYFIPGQIPVIGQFFSIINVLFIFGKERRCLHDKFAGTLVVKC